MCVLGSVIVASGEAPENPTQSKTIQAVGQFLVYMKSVVSLSLGLV